MDISEKNKNIFPKELVSGSVQSQAQLDEAFSKYHNLARGYVKIALCEEDSRKWYEDNWPKVCKYLDDDFLNKFQMETEHDSRVWEFYLATVFVEKGLELESRKVKTGPDFCIKTSSGEKIWVEAITCKLGEKDPVEPYPNLISGKLYTFGGNIEDIQRPRALRITSAISTKFEKFKNYISNSTTSGVSENDILIVAVNGMAIQHHTDVGRLFKRSVFGQGPDVFVKIQGEDKLQGPYYKVTNSIIKKDSEHDESIPANFMEMDEFSKISAVIYCGSGPSHSWLNGHQPGDEFLFAYHVNPKNKLPDNFFKFGRGIVKDIETNTIKDFEQN